MVMISRDHLPRHRAWPMSSDISALIAEDACVNPYAASACSNPAGGDGAVCPFGNFGRVSFISARYSTRQSTPRAGIGQPECKKTSYFGRRVIANEQCVFADIERRGGARFPLPHPPPTLCPPPLTGHPP